MIGLIRRDLNDKCHCDYEDYPLAAPTALAPRIDISLVKRLKCTSCIMKTGVKTGTYRCSRIGRLNYNVTCTQLPVRLY